MFDRIKSLIKNGENISVEFKKCEFDLPKNIFETICAFLNRNGGEILLGVEDDGTLSGIEKSEVQKIKNNFVSLMNNPQKISPTVYLSVSEVEIEGKTILYIYVPESSQVHNTNGKIYDRNEDGDFEVTSSMDTVALMYIRKQRDYTENTIYPYATIEDLKIELIDRVRVMATNRQPHHPWEKLTNEELLKSAGLYQRNMKTGESGYTLACILLFGKDETIKSVLPHHKTDAILRKVNLDRYDDRDDIRCNLIESYDRLMNFIEKHLNDMFYLEGDTRVSVRNKLFREVVGNILIHREYANAFPAKLIISNDDVTTENSNKAHGYGKININDFTPFPKNPVIAGVFKEIGWADELGSGIRNIKNYLKIYSDSEPVFIEGDVFKTILKIKSGDKVAIKSGDKVAIKSGDKVAIKITPQEKIINFIGENVSINSEQAMTVTGLRASRVKQILKKLCEENVIEPRGANKNRIYKLKS
jgi:ATP-dependent DNA helicase RecG